jgi:hypothetical protein
MNPMPKYTVKRYDLMFLEALNPIPILEAACGRMTGQGHFRPRRLRTGLP